MSGAMGPVSFSDGHEQVFLGRDLIQHHRYSQKTAMKIDREVKGIISGCYERAMRLLTEFNPVLKRLAEELIERETVEGHEVREMVRGFRPDPALAS
jgi:cell division protease FtsH